MLVAITKSQISEARGAFSKQLISVIQSVCIVDLKETVQSIQPVITKCPANKPISLDALSGDLQEQLALELSNQKKASLEEHDDEDTMLVNDENFKDLEEFFKEFASKLVIFDPLDREINDDV